ncbi:PEP-CTERM putative exosortase interaction domain-containing protein [Leptolyngbya sp. PCC 7375]|nr:PEP-CTERM putative exosortase interaction domain-containing protein [Leptolyngbya sp. PCC 7375]
MKPLSALLGVVTGAVVTTLGMTSAALAVDFSLRGTFAQDDDVQLFDFSIATESAVTLRTYSYAGGTQADGTFIDAGGFDPVLSLFDGDGNFIFLSDDDESGTVANDPTTGRAYDGFLDIMLKAGDYTLALTQYNNFSNTTNLADGFRQEGNANFTSNFARCTTDSMFCDFTGDVRTNEWALDILGVRPPSEPDEGEPNPPTQVPEPATTLAFALAGVGALVHRRRQT